MLHITNVHRLQAKTLGVHGGRRDDAHTHDYVTCDYITWNTTLLCHQSLCRRRNPYESPLRMRYEGRAIKLAYLKLRQPILFLS